METYQIKGRIFTLDRKDDLATLGMGTNKEAVASGFEPIVYTLRAPSGRLVKFIREEDTKAFIAL